MSEKSDRAAALFSSGFACSQSVLAVFCEDYGLDSEIALKLSSGLGGGFKCGEICGAVSGSVLVIGLKCGQFDVADTESKAVCTNKTREFLRIFRKRNHSVVCREILGCDVFSQKGKEKAAKENLFKTVCVDMVTSAVNILEELGY